MKKLLVFFSLCLAVVSVPAQTIPEPVDPAGPTILIRGQLPPPDLYLNEGLDDYGNLYASFNGINDSSLPYARRAENGERVQDYGGWGGQVAGGFNLYHRLQYGLFYLSYGGSYSRFNRPEFRNGTSQSLSANYSKALSRRWSVRLSEGLFYSSNLGTTLSVIPASGAFPAVQPYSQKAFLNSTSATLGYQVTHRLSYFFGGDLYAALYRPNDVTSYTGLSAITGVSYRFTRHTTLTGSYSLTHLDYTSSSASSRIQTGAITLSQMLTRRIQAGISVGISQSVSSGVADIFFVGVPTDIYVRGSYHQNTLTPNFTGSLFRTARRSRFGITGGQGISGGNGIYTTSKNLFLNGTANYDLGRKLTLSGQVGYSRLSSVANAAATYAATTYNLTAGYRISRHTYANASYYGWHFPQYGTVNNFDAHRITFGVTFATTDFPLPY